MDGTIRYGGGNNTAAQQTVVTYTGGGSGGGGYTVKSSVTPAEEINAQLENAKSIYGREVDSANKAAKDALDNIQKQRTANAQQLLMKKNQLARQSEWQPNQQKEQSTYANLRRTMGNAAYGSGLTDLNEGMSRYDDMADVQLINTFKENQNNAYNSWYQANADLINDYNEQVIRAQNTLDTAYNNYLANIAGIDARLGQQAYGKGNAGGDISRKEDDQTYKTSVRAKDTSINNLLKMLINQASANNPNIPDTAGLVDYIRPSKATYNTESEYLQDLINQARNNEPTRKTNEEQRAAEILKNKEQLLKDFANPINAILSNDSSPDNSLLNDSSPDNSLLSKIYRLYNTGTGEHFYTASEDELNSLLKTNNWKQEGVTSNNAKTSNTPVYRLYNPYNGDHMYTTSKDELNSLKKAGWKDEGIGFYSDDSQANAVYRLYNPYANTGSHLWTNSKDEQQSLLSKGWRDEGIGWYGAA